MTKNYTNCFREINIYKKMSTKSEIISQMIMEKVLKFYKRKKNG